MMALSLPVEAILLRVLLLLASSNSISCFSCVVWPSVRAVAALTPEPGTVVSFQKISTLEGGFAGNLTMGDGTFFKGDLFGRSTAFIGDVDGDDITDMAVGAENDNDGDQLLETGAVWIIFLNRNGTVKNHQKISWKQGSFIGVLTSGDVFGHSVTALGDLNNDAIPDIAVGAPLADNHVGAVWIIFLNRNGTVKSNQKIANSTGNFTDMLIDDDYFGSSLASIDVDNDGVNELAVGAPGRGSSLGRFWILFLSVDGTVKSQQQINNSTGNFSGALVVGRRFGASMTSLGDLDSDGISDIAVGAKSNFQGGAVWIIFLNKDATVKRQHEIESSTIVHTQDDQFGNSVSSVGDVNGDGITDIAVGAPMDGDGDPQNTFGALWIIFLTTSGAVRSHSKISQGDFGGNLTQGDRFGESISVLNRTTCSNVTQIAVGASFDDDGGYNIGAVWILSLHTEVLSVAPCAQDSYSASSIASSAFATETAATSTIASSTINSATGQGSTTASTATLLASTTTAEGKGVWLIVGIAAACVCIIAVAALFVVYKRKEMVNARDAGQTDDKSLSSSSSQLSPPSSTSKYGKTPSRVGSGKPGKHYHRSPASLGEGTGGQYHRSPASLAEGNHAYAKTPALDN